MIAVAMHAVAHFVFWHISIPSLLRVTFSDKYVFYCRHYEQFLLRIDGVKYIPLDCFKYDCKWQDVAYTRNQIMAYLCQHGYRGVIMVDDDHEVLYLPYPERLDNIVMYMPEHEGVCKWFGTAIFYIPCRVWKDTPIPEVCKPDLHNWIFFVLRRRWVLCQHAVYRNLGCCVT